MKLKNTLLVGVVAATLLGCSATNKGVSLDAGPLVKLNQKMPSIALGTDVHTEGPIEATVDNGVGLALPLVGVEAELGTLSVGPDKLNATVGNDNSVTVGPLHVGQSLPKAKLGLAANKEKVFDLRLSGDGLGITLPLISLDIPSPELSLSD